MSDIFQRLFLMLLLCVAGGGWLVAQTGTANGCGADSCFAVAKICWAEPTAAMVAPGTKYQRCSGLSFPSPIATLFDCRKPILSSRSVAHYWPLSRVERIMRPLPALTVNSTRPAQQIISISSPLLTPPASNRRVA